MLPAVTEIVFVDEPVVLGMEEIAKADLLFIMRLGHPGEICGPVVRVGGLVGLLLKPESVKMAIGPAEGELEDVVQLGQFYRGRDKQAAPDGGPDVEERDLQLQLDAGGIKFGAGFDHGGKEAARMLQVYLPHGRV
jgi:hypothetical protein